MTFREALKKDSLIYDLMALLMIGSYVLNLFNVLLLYVMKNLDPLTKHLIVKLIKYVLLFFFIHEACYGIYDPFNLKLHIGLFVFSFAPALLMMWAYIRQYQKMLDDEIEKCEQIINRLNALKPNQIEEVKPQKLLK